MAFILGSMTYEPRSMLAALSLLSRATAVSHGTPVRRLARSAPGRREIDDDERIAGFLRERGCRADHAGADTRRRGYDLDRLVEGTLGPEVLHRADPGAVARPREIGCRWGRRHESRRRCAQQEKQWHITPVHHEQLLFCIRTKGRGNSKK